MTKKRDKRLAPWVSIEFHAVVMKKARQVGIPAAEVMRRALAAWVLDEWDPSSVSEKAIALASDEINLNNQESLPRGRP